MSLLPLCGADSPHAAHPSFIVTMASTAFTTSHSRATATIAATSIVPYPNTHPSLGSKFDNIWNRVRSACKSRANLTIDSFVNVKNQKPTKAEAMPPTPSTAQTQQSQHSQQKDKEMFYLAIPKSEMTHPKVKSCWRNISCEGQREQNR